MKKSERAIFKDARKELSSGGKIRLIGSSIIKFPVRVFQAFKKKCQDKVAKMRNYVSEDIQEKKDKKVDKIDRKIEGVDNSYEEVSSIEVSKEEGTLANDYLKALEERKDKLEAKKEKSVNKKFGLMSVSFMYLKKLTSTRIKNTQERRAQRRQEKQGLLLKKAAIKDATAIKEQLEEFRTKYGCSLKDFLINLEAEQQETREQQPEAQVQGPEVPVQAPTTPEQQPVYEPGVIYKDGVRVGTVIPVRR